MTTVNNTAIQLPLPFPEYAEVAKKVCPKCKNPFPATLEYFHKRSARKCGLQSTCKSCVKKYDHERNQRPENKARSKARNNRPDVKEWHRQHEKLEKTKTTRKKYRTSEHGKKVKKAAEKRVKIDPVRHQKRLDMRHKPANRTRKLERNRQRYTTNKEKQAEYYREHNKLPHVKIMARIRQHNRRALEKNIIGSHTLDEIKALYELQDGRCGYCGMPLRDKYHEDHMHPISRGGTNDIDNILLTCPYCNWAKNDKPLDEWLRWLHGN